MTRVLGIDASLSATGLAWNGGTTTIKYPKDVTGDHRLDTIAHTVASALRPTETLPPVDLAVVEDLPTHAKGAGLTGMAQGVVRLTLVRHKIRYILVPAASLKKYATGAGNAGKPDMRMELFKRTGIDLRDDNQVDATWLWLLGLDLLGQPEIKLPATHRVALDKLTLPPQVTP